MLTEDSKIGKIKQDNSIKMYFNFVYKSINFIASVGISNREGVETCKNSGRNLMCPVTVEAQKLSLRNYANTQAE
jgi:phosphoribosyl-dephospho-CoA transferase